MKISKCQADKERRRIEDCELAALTAVPLATVNIAARTAATSALPKDPGNEPSGHEVQTPVYSTRTVLRVWGSRPFQSASDNSTQAQEYWNEVAELKLKRQPRAAPPGTSLNAAVLAELKQLTPGAGPGVPAHLPLSYDTVQARIVSITCGETFFASLTAGGEVYVVGHGLDGELGLGPKIGAVREPQKLVIELNKVQTGGTGTEEDMSVLSNSRNGSALGEESTLIPGILFHASSGRRQSGSAPRGEPEDVIVSAISAGKNHCMALTDEGEVYVWGHWSACGLLTVENLLYPTCLRDFIAPLTNRRIVAIAAQGVKSSMLSEDGSLYIWGSWPGSAPLMKPLEVAKLQLDEQLISSAQMALGDTMGLICIRLSDDPNVALLYQIGVGVRNEILAVDHSRDDPSVPKFQRLCEMRYNMYVPELLTCHLRQGSGGQCLDIRDIAVGNRHVMILTGDGRVLVWGDNTWGQCGTSGQRLTHISEPALLAPTAEVVVARIFAGGVQSALTTTSGSLYVWGCTRDHRLGNSGIKFLAEAPIRALADGTPGVASLGRGSTIGTSTQASIHDSIFQPERLLSLAPLATTAVGMGQTYMAVASGDADPAIGVRSSI